MRTVSIAVLIIIFISSCQNNETEIGKTDFQKVGKIDLTELIWKDTVIDLGTIKKGGTHPISFHVKNIGNSPLLFEKIESTCGCTVVDTKEMKPILPLQADSIQGHFKLNETNGNVLRKIYILANTKKNFYVLRIKANVVE